jgi:hypothetical protein
VRAIGGTIKESTINPDDSIHLRFIRGLSVDDDRVLLGPTRPLFPAYVASFVYSMYEHALTTTLLNYFGAIAIGR